MPNLILVLLVLGSDVRHQLAEVSVVENESQDDCLMNVIGWKLIRVALVDGLCDFCEM